MKALAKVGAAFVALLAAAGAARAAAPSADAAIARCESLVRQEVADCGGRGRAETLFAVRASSQAAFLGAAIRLQGCRAIARNSPLPCDALATMGGAEPAQSCGHMRHQFDFFALRARSPKGGRRICLDYMNERPRPHIADYLPEDLHETLCEAIETGRDRAEVLKAVQSKATAPLSELAVSELTTGRVLGLLLEPQTKCKSCAQGLCCDLAATARAARGALPADCGGSPYCRAELERDEAACAPLQDALVLAACPDAGSPARRAAQAQRLSACSAASDALGAGPDSDPGAGRLRARLEALRSAGALEAP